MKRAVMTGLALTALALPATARTIQDFDRALPRDIDRMHRADDSPGIQGPMLTVKYGQGMGIATVFVRPLASPAPDGIGPVAENDLRAAMAADIKRGAPMLGETYWTSAPRTHTIQANGLDLTCQTIERRQGGEATSPDQVRLLNRWCVRIIDNHILAVHLTTPFKEEMADFVDKGQIGFIAKIAVAMQGPAATPAPPPRANAAPLQVPRPNVPIARPPALPN